MSTVFLSSKFLGLTPKSPECTCNINVIQQEQQVWDCSRIEWIPSSVTHLQCNFGQVTFLNSSLFNFKTGLGTSLVVQWLRLHLSMQGMGIRSLVR